MCFHSQKPCLSKSGGVATRGWRPLAPAIPNRHGKTGFYLVFLLLILVTNLNNETLFAKKTNEGIGSRENQNDYP